MSTQSEIPFMAYEKSGSGKPLILVPGGLTGWISWIPHAEALAASRQVTRVQLLNVALGLAGEPLPPGYALTTEVAALDNTLNDLGIETADFACWSYGGAITLSYAIHNPQRMRSLTLIEPPAYWVLRSRSPFSKQLLEEQGYFQTLATENVSEEQLVFFSHYTGLVPEDVDPRTIPPWPVWLEHRQSLRLADAPFLHEDSIELLRAFEKRVLLVKGEGSSPRLHDIIDVLAEELPNAEVITFPGGHAPHIVSMQPFLERYTRFLSEPDYAQ